MQANQTVGDVLFQYAAKYRMNGHTDADITNALYELGVDESEAKRIIQMLDDPVSKRRIIFI